MTAHKHAALMLKYAQDALGTDKPWEKWEYKLPNDMRWQSYEGISRPSWDEDYEYRRKPKTLTYTVTIPEPMREAPKKDTEYWLAEPYHEAFTTRFKWEGDTSDTLWLKRGLCFATKEDAIAAAKAMMPVKGGVQ